MPALSSVTARRAVSAAHRLLQVRRMKSAFSRLRRLAGYGQDTSEQGPLVAVVKLHGVLRAPRSRGAPSRSDTALSFDKHSKHVDAAFKEKDVRAVALDVNCPGEALELHSVAPAVVWGNVYSPAGKSVE